MNTIGKIRRFVMWVALVVIAVLTITSIYGAFLGQEKAKDYFNSVPLSIYWVLIFALLVFAVFLFRRLMRVPGLLLIHLGCIAVLVGAMAGSEQGHETLSDIGTIADNVIGKIKGSPGEINIVKKFLGANKIVSGQMVIYEGYAVNRVQVGDTMETLVTRELPFYLKLRDFRLEYYPGGNLILQDKADPNQVWTIPVEIGSEYDLGEKYGSVRILKTFENFKMIFEGGQRNAIDSDSPGTNPAVEIEFKTPSGKITKMYVFQLYPGHESPEARFLTGYFRDISDYISDLQVIADNKVVKEVELEVNHPLHYGGYHFYQSSYDAENGTYTVLSVTSDTGLNVVYAGYIMLIAGVFWQLWLRHLFRNRKIQSE